MKVRCKKITDQEDEKISQISNGWLTIGKLYNVLTLGINLIDFSKSSVQIEPDNFLHPIIEKLSNFELIDHNISENFGFYISKDQMFLDLEPCSWHDYESERGNYGFWEDFFDHERSAIELYRKEVAFIKGETYEPLPSTKPDAKELLEIYRRRERDGLIPNQGFNEAFEPMALTSTENWKP